MGDQNLFFNCFSGSSDLPCGTNSVPLKVFWHIYWPYNCEFYSRLNYDSILANHVHFGKHLYLYNHLSQWGRFDIFSLLSGGDEIFFSINFGISQIYGFIFIATSLPNITIFFQIINYSGSRISISNNVHGHRTCSWNGVNSYKSWLSTCTNAMS